MTGMNRIDRINRMIKNTRVTKMTTTNGMSGGILR